MANIRVDLEHTIQDGIDLTFDAPCDCSQITGLIVYYPSYDMIVSKQFTFRDAHKNDLKDLTDLFAEGARIKVNLDVTNGYAYIQNADTNAYLENKFNTFRQDIDRNAEDIARIIGDMPNGIKVFRNTNINVTKVADGFEIPLGNTASKWNIISIAAQLKYQDPDTLSFKYVNFDVLVRDRDVVHSLIIPDGYGDYVLIYLKIEGAFIYISSFSIRKPKITSSSISYESSYVEYVSKVSSLTIFYYD